MPSPGLLWFYELLWCVIAMLYMSATHSLWRWEVDTWLRHTRSGGGRWIHGYDTLALEVGGGHMATTHSLWRWEVGTWLRHTRSGGGRWTHGYDTLALEVGGGHMATTHSLWRWEVDIHGYNTLVLTLLVHSEIASKFCCKT